MWHLASTPPPLVYKGFNRKESEPVLAYLGHSVGQGMSVVTYSRYFDEDTQEFDDEECWIDTGSEAWDVSCVITHWQHLPEKPLTD
jgi:hypothetical protein